MQTNDLIHINSPIEKIVSKIVVLYAYYEKNQSYKENLLFFLKYGYISDENIDFIIIINGQFTIVFPQIKNLFVIQRENTGYDFQAWNTGLKSLSKKQKVYDYYIFLNSSVRGPFIPTYSLKYMRWYQGYIDLLKNDVKLVGSTICLLPPNSYWNPQNPNLCPCVQTYVFAMDNDCVNFLLSTGFWEKSYNTVTLVSIYQERLLSILVLANGWNISCLIPEYQNRNYKNLKNNFNPTTNSIGDIALNGLNTCFGRTIHPYEVLFMKNNRPNNTNYLSLMSLSTFSFINLPIENDTNIKEILNK